VLIQTAAERAVRGDQGVRGLTAHDPRRPVSIRRDLLGSQRGPWPGWSTPRPSPGRLDGSLTAWHDQWLWPCLNRVKAGHYTISGCRQHHEPGRAHRALTDRFIVGP
jgi:hypothetical protein